MFIKSVIFIVALVYCQGAFGYVQKSKETIEAITSLSVAIDDALYLNKQHYTTLLSHVQVSIYESEYSGLTKIRKIVNEGMDQALVIEEETMQEEYNVTKCIADAIDNLVYWKDNNRVELKECSENLLNKSRILVSGTSEHSIFEATGKVEDYKKEFDDCILDKSESCLNELLYEVNQDIKAYPKMLQEIYDSVEKVLHVYEKSMKRSSVNAVKNVAFLTEEFLSDLETCIDSKMMHDILHNNY